MLIIECDRLQTQNPWKLTNNDMSYNLDPLLNLHGLELNPSTYSDFIESYVDYIKYYLSQEKNLTCTDRLAVIR